MLDEAESLFESRLPPTALLAGPTVAALARVIAVVLDDRLGEAVDHHRGAAIAAHRVDGNDKTA